MADQDDGRSWSFFPPTPTHVAEAEKQEKLLLSNTSNNGTNLVVNYMGLIIGFIFLLIVRQMMDFFTAVYAPYGDDEYAEGRYDDYNYHDDFKPYTQQFRGFDGLHQVAGLAGEHHLSVRPAALSLH